MKTNLYTAIRRKRFRGEDIPLCSYRSSDTHGDEYERWAGRRI